MNKKFLFIGWCVFTSLSSFSQVRILNTSVNGTIIDADDKNPVMQATVQLLSPKDSVMVVGNVTDFDGNFSLNTKSGKYLLKISYIGYKSVYRSVVIPANKKTFPIGKIELESDAIMLDGAVVVAQAPEVTAISDTLVYSSSAYRLPEGSALEELVKKLPGAEIDEEGKITINGKEVKRIMIDGKEFFMDDPQIALKNLPVNIIDKVKAYDKESDMAKATGIKDGEEETVLDLSVKPGMNKGWFGNADLSGGTKDRYSGKVLLNRFNGDNKFTLIGSSNNVNDDSYPGGGGSGHWRKPNGLNTSHMAGFNFVTESDKWKNNGSIDFSLKENDIRSKSASETFVSETVSAFSNSRNINNNRDLNLNANFRIEWNPDTTTMILIRPKLSIGDTDSRSGSKSFSFDKDPVFSTDELLDTEDITSLVDKDNIINKRVRSNVSRNNSMNYGLSVLFNKRLSKPGRNITLWGSVGYSDSDTEQFSMSETEYFQKTEEEQLEILNRYINTPTNNYNYSARLSYSEPVFKDMFIQFSYFYQYKRSKSDNSTFDMPDTWTIENGLSGNTDGIYNKDLSKSAIYGYRNHRVDVSYKWITGKTQLNVGASIHPQHTELDYKKGTLDTVSIRSVLNFTPTLDFRYKFSKTSQLRIDYRGRSSQPSMTDLLPVTDNTDPLNIRVGNPNLKPAFTNTLRLMFNTFNAETQRGVMTHFQFNNTLNSISSRRRYNSQTGGYITKPENIDGNWNLFGILGTNIALRNKKFTISSFTLGRYNNIVGYMSSDKTATDMDKNTTRETHVSERLRGTYRNDWWEVSLNGSLKYTHSHNSFKTANNMDTYQFSYGASTNINLPWKMTVSTDLSQNSRRGYTNASMNRDELIWNAQISQNFLKGNAATISLQVYDILRNQSNISRSISAAMRSDVEYNGIYSYCMVHFIYRLNLFGGKMGTGKMGFDSNSGSHYRRGSHGYRR